MCSEKAISKKSHLSQTFNMIAKMPFDQKVAAACDKGMIELFDGSCLDGIAEMLSKDWKRK